MSASIAGVGIPRFNLPSFDSFIKNTQQKCAGNNIKLTKAKVAGKDEWYTKLSDIESECDHYVEYFRNKNILCPCDGVDSNFVKYFESNFDRLELESLTATSFNPHGYGLKYTKIRGKEPEHTSLMLNGDWRSPDVLKLIRNADVVVTNPPFSFFKKITETLVHYGTDYLVLGNLPTCGSKKLANFIKNKKMRFGYFGGDTMEFVLADHYTEFMRSETNSDGSVTKYASVSSICWVTSLPVHKPLGRKLTAVYDPDKYYRYDNYDAIDVPRCKDIPKDYDGVMGVPISFTIDWDPIQFDIIGFSSDNTRRELCLNGEKCFTRVFIKRRTA